MQSIAYLSASNGSANASLMTVTNIRAALANTIKVNTVANVPAKFSGSMGTPHNFVDPVTGETITIISEATAVDFFGSVSGSDIIIDQIAAGYTDLGSKVGDIIVIKPTTEDKNNLKNILAADHNDNGTHMANTVNPVGTMVDYAGVTAPSGWLLAYGQAVSRATYASLFAVLNPSLGVTTMTIAAPGVVTLTNHGLVTGDAVYFTTTGALPTGLTANTVYYAVKIDANTFNLATSVGNAMAGTKITTSGTQSGVHTLLRSPYGVGDGSTTFNIPDARGRAIAGNDQMGGTAASRLTGSASGGVYGQLVGYGAGEQAHQLTVAELASHTHNWLSGNGGAAGGGAFTAAINNAGFNTGAPSEYAGGNAAHNVVQPTLVLNKIIKV